MFIFYMLNIIKCDFLSEQTYAVVLRVFSLQRAMGKVPNGKYRKT